MTEQQRPALPSKTLDQARDLRRASTDAERKLWRRIRSVQLPGFKFRRQHPFPPYIVDFFCHAANLVIEIDGSQHSAAADQARTRFLESRGLTVLRFGNHQVLQETDAVVDAIFNACQASAPHPGPLPEGEGVEP